uniref:Bifunctional UDP-glucuronic acid decarboxylase/UDP-4-amino-4-deoxy-L-arabinose formyltransferase (ArnA, pmrI) n=1 Tax=uncultured marine thaumarchaeote KM3_89_C12 TaxID=1456339 RepID=A0A075HVE9_9ARCH|nr:bifunctional UDP-glucuronic acid decarboxylase/UDP-4-amino-4-deoxy-L-arabinose formyltransferase (arnA, pmrI) [uncultured marine thaumarchaeote KM3_89_C12]
MDQKIVVCGCTDFGYEIVDFLLTNGVNISHLVSLSPEQAIQYKVSGYKSFEPLSTKYGIPIYYPKLYSMKETDSDFFEKEKFDLLLVCGWQRLIPDKILETIKICGIGSHGSSELLPKGRGRSPVNWSIIEGKKQFILQLFILTPEIDDGDIVYHETFDINEWDTCKTIYYKTSIVMKRSLLKLIPSIFSNNFSRIPQSGEPSFYPKRTPEDGLIDWNKPLKEIHDFVKALTKPYPGAFSFIDKQKIMIWEAQPFDRKITFSDAKLGEIVEKFSTGDFVVKCSDGTLLITDYEGVINKGEFLSKL